SASACAVRRPALPTLFPYTTLFRSRAVRTVYFPSFGRRTAVKMRCCRIGLVNNDPAYNYADAEVDGKPLGLHRSVGGRKNTLVRSEEHTSELQSREKLVCRLRLDKN